MWRRWGALPRLQPPVRFECQSQSMTIHRAQLFQLRLSRAQASYMAKAAGTARFAYNWALEEWERQAAEWRDAGEVGAYPSAFALQKQFNAIKREQFPWTADVSGMVPEKAIFAVGVAFEGYRSGTARYPRFKSRTGKKSFVAATGRTGIRVEGQHVVLWRAGRLRLVAKVRWPEATPIGATISQRAGKWFVAITFEMDDKPVAAKPVLAAGVDLGIKCPLVVTAGDLTLRLGAGLSQRLNVERRKLRRANKRLHRRVKGSGRRWRAQQRAARIQQRMANIRADVQHKATSQISAMAARIGVETLGVRGMMRNGRMARAIADVGFYEIKRQLKYKADQVVEADRFYPSSKTCSSCGSIKTDLKLSDRTYRCECGFECDRDENAARNLEKMAANCAVSARGARSPARRRKLTLSSLAMKREAAKAAQ